MANPKLRAYQRTAIESARRALTKSGSCVLQMPTGAGKTRAATEIVATSLGVIWFVCHRREIIRQAAKAFAAAGIDFGIVSPAHKFQPGKRVQIASVQTLPNRMKEMRDPKLVIWDECHHVAAKSWSKIRKALHGVKHLGLTATPERLDGKGLKGWFSSLVTGPGIRPLIDKGFLSEFRYFAPSEPDLKNAKLQAGDYRKADVAKAMNTPVLIGDAISEYRKNADGKRALVFAASVDSSRAVVERFNAEGIAAAHVDGTTPSDERDAAIADLAAGRIRVLSNVEVFTEGFDLPAIDAVILLRPTKSIALFLQMIGRGLRRAKGKDGAVIMDHAGLWLDHGWPDAEMQWSLDGGARQAMLSAAKATGGRLRRCPECKEVRAERAEVCACGYEFQTGREVGEFDGQLWELRGEVPEGCVTREHFSRIIGCSCGKVAGRLFRSGLPSKGIFVPVREALDWCRANWHPPGRAPFGVENPDEWVSRADFAKEVGLSTWSIRKLCENGMPSHRVNGWIERRVAIAWLASYKETPKPEPILRDRRIIAPAGYIRASEFCAANNIKYNRIITLVRMGMPCWRNPDSKQGFIWVNQSDAREWISQYDSKPSNTKPPTDSAPGEYISGRKFCMLFSSSIGNAEKKFSKLKKRGIPLHPQNGWVHIKRGLEWVRDNTQIPIPDSAWPKRVARAKRNQAQQLAA